MSQRLPAPSPAKYLEREMTPAGSEFYRRLAETGRASTTRCESCRVTTFPPRPRCSTCGAEQVWAELPEVGCLYAFTTQETALRFGAPAVLALARLGEAVLPGVVHARYRDLRIEQAISTRTFAEPDTGLTLLEFVPR